MILNVTFIENNKKLDVEFKEIYQITDGGFEKGYDLGYKKGVADTTPKGTIDINSNGDINVKQYEFANVNVPIPEGYLKPSGTLDITSNGEHNVYNYEKVNVNVEQDFSNEDGLITRTLTSYYNDRITKVGVGSFMQYSTLKELELPNVVEIVGPAFSGGIRLNKLKLPKLERLSGSKAFDYIGFEELASPLKYIGSYAIIGVAGFKRLIITQDEEVCTLAHTNAFQANGIGSGTAYAYVPDSKLEEYKIATNWSTFASAILGWSELPQEIRERLGLV